MMWDSSSASSFKLLLLRLGGPAAMVGGLLGVLAIFLHSLEPTGCVGSECSSRQMRTTSVLVAGIGSFASLLVLIGVVGLALMARRSGRPPKLMKAGLALVGVGFLALLTAVFIQGAIFSGDFPGMPYFVIFGMVALFLGFVLIGIFILRSGVLPRWLGIFLIASSAMLLAANEQNSSVLLAIPFQLAIATAGYFLWHRTKQLSSFPESRSW